MMIIYNISIIIVLIIHDDDYDDHDVDNMSCC